MWGSAPQFVITAKERRAAEADEAFRLVVVLNALESSRRQVELTGAELLDAYNLIPLAYRAVEQ